MLEGKKKAIVLLSEGRSGTTFFASRINATNTMGQIDEWFDIKPPEKGGTSSAFEALYQEVVKKGSCENSNFGLKLFPRHLYAIQQKYGVDCLARLADDFDLLLVFLERKDRLAQTVSFCRALQTGRWRGSDPAPSEIAEEYDFNRLCRLFFFIGESYEFWRSYLAAKQLPYIHCYYEDVIQSDGVIEQCADFFGLSSVSFPKSQMKKQRDNTSEAWRERLEAELLQFNALENHPKLQLPMPTKSNLWRLIRHKPIKPYPFSY